MSLLSELIYFLNFFTKAVASRDKTLPFYSTNQGSYTKPQLPDKDYIKVKIHKKGLESVLLTLVLLKFPYTTDSIYARSCQLKLHKFFPPAMSMVWIQKVGERYNHFTSFIYI